MADEPSRRFTAESPMKAGLSVQFFLVVRRNFQPAAERVDIKPVLLKEKLFLQINSHLEKNVLTKNVTFAEFAQLNLLEEGFANFLVETRTESL